MPLFFLFDRKNISIDLLSWKERWNAKLRWYDGESYGSIALLSEFTKQSREGDFAVMDFNIFIIEDDAAIFSSLKERLEQWSFHVTRPERFDDVMNTFINMQTQLVIIDIQLPMYDGFHWCREIRAVSSSS